MTRWIASGFNIETGELWRLEERDRAGAEHAASSWLEDKPIGSLADVLQSRETDHGHQTNMVTSYKRVLGGVELKS